MSRGCSPGLTPVKDGTSARGETGPWKSRPRRYDDERSRVRAPEEGCRVRPETVPARPLFESPEMKVVRATFRAGQFIPVHAPNVHVALYILSGEGEVVAGKERRKVTEGDLVVVRGRSAGRQGEDGHDRAARRLAVPHAGRPRGHGGRIARGSSSSPPDPGGRKDRATPPSPTWRGCAAGRRRCP